MKGFIHPTIDPESFSVGEHYVRREAISSIELTNHYFECWKELLPKEIDAVDK